MASQSSVATATSKFDKLCADNRRSASRALDFTPTGVGLRLQRSTLQTSIFQVALHSQRGERDRYMDLLRSFVGQIDR